MPTVLVSQMGQTEELGWIQEANVRPWRKLHSSILESERFMDVSLEAKVLFFLLVAAQDDTGYYPWERMKIRHLTAVCAWTEKQAHAYAQVLVDHGMAVWEEGGIVLRKGIELNGKPRDDRKGVVYQRSTTDSQLPVTDSQRYVLEEEEEEEKRKKKEPLSTEVRKKATPSHTLPLTEEDKTVWPDWYGRLWDIPGFKVPLSQAQAWLDKQAISVELAETTAYSLKSKWPGPTKSPYRDVWATFQTWCRNAKSSRNGASNGQLGGNLTGNYSPEENYRIPRGADGKIILGSKPSTML